MTFKAGATSSKPTMKRGARYAFTVASAISAVSAIYHLIGGTPEVMHPLYAANLPPESAGILDVLWYQMAALLVGAAVATLFAAYRSHWRLPVAWMIGSHFLITSAICLIFSFSYFGNAWGLPQWILFALIGIITFWAANRSSDG